MAGKRDLAVLSTEVICLKIPPALRDEIERQARRHDRSFNSYLRRRLAVVFGMPELFAPPDEGIHVGTVETP